MEVLWNNDTIDPAKFMKPVVTIGNFDGCHIGHQKIFQRARDHAGSIGGVCVVYTFNPHPASVVKGVTPQLIFTLEEKIEAIRCMDVDFLVIAPFTREFADTNPEVFVKETIVRRMGAQGLVVGHDFSFGKKAAGDIPFLKRIGSKMGFFVECVDPVSFEGAVISSTCVRKMILSGDVAGAARVMKYPYRLHGPVIHGMARGRNLGFPTANIEPNKDLIPAYGVYAVYIHIEGRRFDGVVNVGNNPTFGDVGTSIEAFIFDFEEDLYKKKLTVEFIEHIRGEIKFADKEYLIEQIRADCTLAREILKKRKKNEDLRNI
ncbi:MAG TPA: bifunctional riboflavin kinase/FAD synthetase [Deltaproteobacteria bacterium]|nr:bifunctional riboflavin kinase/FAD synthetase [Deltaproteobacteria bacterium]